MNLALQHFQDMLFVRKELPNIKGFQNFHCFQPVALPKRPGGSHHMIADIFRRTSEGLPLIYIQKSAKGLANDLPLHVMGIGSHVWHLQEHRTYEMDSFEKLQVDVHVERHLPPPFLLLLHSYQILRYN